MNRRGSIGSIIKSLVTYDGGGHGAGTGACRLFVRQGKLCNAGAEGNTPNTSNEKPYEVSLFYPGTPQKDVALVEAEINKRWSPRLEQRSKLMP